MVGRIAATSGSDMQARRPFRTKARFTDPPTPVLAPRLTGIAGRRCPRHCGGAGRRACVFCARLAVIAAALVTVAAAHATPTACAADEETLFLCRTARVRIVAVCASKGWSAHRGHLQYRYGLPGRAEIVLPAAGTPPAQSVAMGNLMFSRGGGAALRFESGIHRYTVYQAISSYWGEKAGVGVYRNGEQIANHRCRGAVVVPVETELLKRGGIDYEENWFDLPH